MSEIVVAAQGLGKRYRISHQRARYGRLTDSIAGMVQAPFDRLRGKPQETVEWVWALQDVTFDISQGDVVGIVGRNGAGKTTLLKLLSRITEPSAGQVDMTGRVASLLEVGTGFHPELTGRENIYLSGSILGMASSETDRRFDEIVAFADVERYLDTPVKRYSSGMQVRLGFAVAAHLETEILIVDEVLAVGDAAFQKKCIGKMGDVADEGRTILFVSHNMAAVEALCKSGILIEKGKLVATGTAKEVVARYLDNVAAVEIVDIADRSDRTGDGRLRFKSIESSIRTGEDSEIRLGYEAESELRNVEVSVAISTMRGERAANLWTESTGLTLASVPTRGTIVCHIPRAPFMPGQYGMNVFARVSGEVADWVIDAATIDVAEGDFFGTGKLPPVGYGHVIVPHSWHLATD